MRTQKRRLKLSELSIYQYDWYINTYREHPCLKSLRFSLKDSSKLPCSSVWYTLLHIRLNSTALTYSIILMSTACIYHLILQSHLPAESSLRSSYWIFPVLLQTCLCLRGKETTLSRHHQNEHKLFLAAGHEMTKRFSDKGQIPMHLFHLSPHLNSHVTHKAIPSAITKDVPILLILFGREIGGEYSFRGAWVRNHKTILCDNLWLDRHPGNLIGNV